MQVDTKTAQSPPDSTKECSDPALVIFDLDGTLIRGDTFLPFLISYAWSHRRIWPLMVLPFYVGLYVCRILSDRVAKERLIGVFFRRQPVTRITAHAERFCEQWVPRRFREDVVAKLREHQAAGHRVVLVSASPDLYVPHIGKLLGITEVVCTQIAFEEEVCIGTMVSHNCKGANKIELLKKYLGIDAAPEHSYAYGDSPSDLPLALWVRHGHMIGRAGITPVLREAQLREKRS